MNALLGIFSAFGLSASAGLNAYIPLLVVGVLAHYTNLIKLSSPWDALANPWILIMLGLLLIIEMLADKIPAVNHINDAIQTFVRPAAGAVAFAASTNVIQGINPLLAMACGLLVAGSSPLAKSAVVRPLVTVSTAGAGNVPVSVAEDATATAVSFISILLPIAIVVLVLMLIVFLLWWFGRRSEKAADANTTHT